MINPGEKDLRFPKERMGMIRRHAKYLKISEEEAISRGIGLLEVWIQAHRKKGTIIERSKNGKELQIDVLSVHRPA